MSDNRPEGRWLPTNDADKKRCSKCDVTHLIAQYPHGQANFCPNCGACMCNPCCTAENLDERKGDTDKVNVVTVRWFDGYLEEFEAVEVRFGSDLLWMRLADGRNRHIPLRQVRWFGMSVESHQKDADYDNNYLHRQ